MVKFLIIRFSSIGDIVLTTPVVRAIKNQVEGAEIHYFVKPQFKDVLAANPYIDEIVCLEKNLTEQLKSMKFKHYDYIIDLHKNIRSYSVKNTLKTIAFSFDKLNFEKWLIVNFKIDKLAETHIVDRYIESLKVFDIKNDNKGLDYFIPEKDNVNLSSLPNEFQKNYIAFAIGANHSTKRLPTEKIIEIIKKIGKPIILLGGPSEFDTAEIILAESGKIVYNGCNEFNINQSASIVQQAKLVITHDTGIMHIAAAFRKTIISVWGNTIPKFGMYPYFPDDKSEIIEVENLKCRPCSKIGFSRCPKKHFKCMNEIDVDRIVELTAGNY
ncbi:MAG: glycosyltransferase family 9 protein [Bacteroidetes bacterium]|nr:glycosyltransferase family 9 protein [Bacteroidota bacterium]MBT6687364.1 glycosyltransferase family 9 protein [Bacteroidota bacterium]MBT7143915.1 glycosyltransferase family 9 protein [Bacteroidota bacterium]MBT7492419.1 glycosyltransferase family 9 protein [Bacteroidota bacterium]